MKTESPLNNAITLARKGRYGKAVSVLVPQILNYRDNWLFYYTLALASLYAGDTGGARDYIKSAYDIKGNETSILLLLAALNIKRGETSRAVNYYLQVLEHEPKNRIAEKGLSVLKKYGGSGHLNEWVEAGSIKSLFPPFPRKVKKHKRTLVLIAPFCALVVAGAFFMAWKNGFVLKKPESDRAGFNESALLPGDREKVVVTEGAWRYVLTEKQVLASYNKARAFFNKHRDDAARVEINRILWSNVSEGIKNKARILADALETAGFDTIKDRFSYAQALKDPPLYDGCTILWKGMAANIEAGQKTVVFNLLVDYDTRSKLEGIVRVAFNRALEVSAERPLEVLGKLVYNPDETCGFQVEGIAIHQGLLP